MPLSGTEVAILGSDMHDDSFHQIDKDVSTSDHLLISSSEIPTDDMSTDISALEKTIAKLKTNLKKTKAELKRTNDEAEKTKLAIESHEEKYAQQVKKQEQLQAKKDALLAEHDKIYQEELEQQIESTEQAITGIQHNWELVDDTMKTIEINIESCNDLLNYLKYISDALEQLNSIKILTEEEQPQDEGVQLNYLVVIFINEFLKEELKNPINVQEALNALANSLNALEKLLSILEIKSLESVLESGRSVQTKLAQISTLGKSVPEILTQAKQSISNTSDTEILEAQIAVLQHGELYSPLSSFIENLQTIMDNRVKFATLMQSMFEEQESILEVLKEKLAKLQKSAITPEDINSSEEFSNKLSDWDRELTLLTEKIKNAIKTKAEYELDNLNLHLNNQHSTIDSLESKIKKLVELKRQAEKELERLENFQVPSSPITPSTRTAEIDEPEIDLYTEEQFTSYDEAIKQLPNIDELIQKLGNLIITEKNKEMATRVSDFHKIAKNCTDIRQLLEKYNNCEIKIREARQKITELERETIVTIQAAELATEQAAELYKQARIDEARLQEEAELSEQVRIKAAVIKIAEGKTTRASEAERLEAERSKTDAIIAELYKQPRLQEKEAKMLRAKEQMLEQEVQSTKLEKASLEDECSKINQKLWELFSTNEGLENMNFILLRIKREYSSNSENPYELDRNLAIHLQTLSQMKIFVDYLEERHEEEARQRQQAIAEEAARLPVVEEIAIQGGIVQAVPQRAIELEQAILVVEEEAVMVGQAVVEEHAMVVEQEAPQRVVLLEGGGIQHVVAVQGGMVQQAAVEEHAMVVEQEAPQRAIRLEQAVVEEIALQGGIVQVFPPAPVMPPARLLPVIHPAVPPPAAVPPVMPPARPLPVIHPAGLPPAGHPPIIPPVAAAAPLAPAGIPPVAVVPPVVAAPASHPSIAPAEPIDDDWVMVDAVVTIEEEVIIVPKATTTIEIPTVTKHDIALQTNNEPKLEVKVLPPITETHTSKIENLSIKYEFSPVTRKSGNVTDEGNINSDDETKTLLLSRFNPTIRDRADLTETDVPMVTPYYNTLMLWQDRRRPDKRSLPKVIDRFGYKENIRVC